MKRMFLWLSFILIPLLSFADGKIPFIKEAKISDSNYLQLIFDIQNAYKNEQQGKSAPRLHLFRYTVQPNETFYKIAAQFNTNAITLASLNRLSSADELKPGMQILLSNRKGIFLPQFKTAEFLPIFMKHSRILPNEKYPILTIEGKKWYFLEDENFSSSEYAFFLKILYKYPLDEGVLSSDYGMREDPINHKDSWHKGIDLAAPLGSNVFAANDGTVSDIGHSDIYGNYILLTHGNGYQTFYAHLSEILVTRFKKVNAGMLIGKVGDTGRTTGPHLHFEMRRGGKTVDPKDFIRLK